MKKIVFLVVVMMFGISLFAQEKRDAETIKKELSETNEQISKLQGKAKALQTEIDELPGWKFGAFGTAGMHLSGFKNWYSNTKPNLSSGHIGVVANIYANLHKKKYFWLNYMNANLAWEKSYNKDKDKEDKGYEGKTDVFKLSSLYGYKLSEKIALSGLAEYNGTLIDNFNDPGFLDLGIGVTWTPVENLIVSANPLNYNIIFSGKHSHYKSSLGGKLMVDYSRSFGKLNLKTNFTTFMSYASNNYSNWTWTNSIAYTFWKGIGIGFNFGLRQNRQEDFNSELVQSPTLEKTDDVLQSFWLFGLSYAM